MNIEYHPIADEEILEIGSHYVAVRPLLGQDFARELQYCISRIQTSPLMFEEVQPGIRRCSMRQFPYGIYFRMPDRDTVRIIVVRHHSRRPGFGLRRK